MKISVVIVCHNQADYITHAVEASLMQLYGFLDLLVIDNGSKDETWSMCQNFKSKSNFAAVRLSKPVSTYLARNLALLLTQGDGITFHDCCDIPSPHKLFNQVNAIGCIGDHNHRIDAVWHRHHLHRMDGSTVVVDGDLALIEGVLDNYRYPAVSEEGRIIEAAGLYRRDFFHQAGAFRAVPYHEQELSQRLIGSNYGWTLIPYPLMDRYEAAMASASLTEGGSLQRYAPRWRSQATHQPMVQRRRNQPRFHQGVEKASLREIIVGDFINAQNIAIDHKMPIEGYYQIARKYAEHSGLRVITNSRAKEARAAP